MSWKTTMYNTTKLTLELREIVENGVDIFDFDYPSFYKGDDKKKFEQKVIDHYYFRQIGQETVGRFKHMLKSKMNDIMPYYIQLYESEKYMQELDDPFATVDYTETFEQTSSDESSGSEKGGAVGTQSGKDSNERRFSNTPQGSISNLDNYMTEASKEENDVSNISTSESDIQRQNTNKGTVKHTMTKKGAMGVTTFGHDMLEFRQTFLNIDLMIIKELNDLFLGVY